MLKTKWVKKKVSKKEWENYYSKIPSYCFLDKNNDGVSVGFLVANFIPAGCLEIIDIEELRAIDTYRRNINIRPFVLEEEKQMSLDNSKDNTEEMQKTKQYIKEMVGSVGGVDKHF
jgi:hypothetical protein